MIHFFPTFSRNAASGPFGLALREIGVPSKIIAGSVQLRYRSRYTLFLVGTPKLLWFSIRSSIQSLLLQQTPPDAVILGSDIHVLVYSAFRRLFRRPGVKIVYLGFIFTERGGDAYKRLKYLYVSAVIRLCDKIIVHSSYEAKRYQKLFDQAEDKFSFVPWGTDIPRLPSPLTSNGNDDVSSRRPYIVAAGRSGRDYRTMFDAVRGLDIAVHVVCDAIDPVLEQERPPNVILLRDCYDRSYLEQLEGALICVIPLSVGNISAGQMVLLQAMALSKAIVITRTVTVEEYARNEIEVKMVPLGDIGALRTAIIGLVQDAARRERMGQCARRRYLENFTLRQYLIKVVDLALA
jgi:glycosyltransferase involved in cell wall biosynthesis